MSFEDFKNKYTSEKIILAHVEASKRLLEWELYSGNIYRKKAEYFVIKIIQDSIKLENKSSIEDIDNEGQWYYDADNAYVYLWSTGGVDPANLFTTVNYRLMFSNTPINLPYDLNTGKVVSYEPIIQNVSSIKSRYDDKDNSIPNESSCSIVFNNDLDYWSDKFEFLVFDNKEVDIYVYGRELEPSEAQIIFSGYIIGKQYQQQRVQFKINDFAFKLRNQPNIPVYTELDGNVSPDSIGKPKRRVYGKVKGLACTTLDAINETIPLTGTFTATVGQDIITSSGANLKEQLSPGDTIVDGDFEYTVEALSRVDIGLDSKAELIITTSGLDMKIFSTSIDTLGLKQDGFVAISGPEITTANRGVWKVKSITDQITVDDWTQLSGATLTVNINGVPTNLVEGSDWSAVSSNDVTADNLRNAIDSLTGVTAPNPPANIIDVTGDSTYKIILTSSVPDELIVDRTAFTVTKATGTPVPQTIEVEENAIVAAEKDDPTTIKLGDVVERDLSNSNLEFKTDITYRLKNRSWNLTHHACNEATADIKIVRTTSLFTVDDASKFFVNDLVIVGTQIRQITSTANNNIRFSQAIADPAVGQTIKRLAIQRLTFKRNDFLYLRDFTVTNNLNGVDVSLTDTAERDAIPSRSLFGSADWEDGSRIVYSYGYSFKNLKERDWIIPSGTSTWYEIQEKVSDSVVILRDAFSGTSGIFKTQYKQPTYLDNDSILIAEMYGKTVDGTVEGDLISQSSQMVQDLLQDEGMSDRVNPLSFSGTNQTDFLISYKIPKTKQGTLEPLRTIFKEVNKSTLSTIYSDKDYKINYQPIVVFRDENYKSVDDVSHTNYSIQTDGSRILKKGVFNYNWQDADLLNEEEYNDSIDIESDYVLNYDKAGNQAIFDLYLINKDEAIAIGQRLLFMREQNESFIKVRLSNEYLDATLSNFVFLDFVDIFGRYGDKKDKVKKGVITSIDKDGEVINITASDLGGLYERCKTITDSSSPEYTAASINDKRFDCYITDNDGLINGKEDTYDTNLIF